jgi:hypothetical protein
MKSLLARGILLTVIFTWCSNSEGQPSKELSRQKAKQLVEQRAGALPLIADLKQANEVTKVFAAAGYVSLTGDRIEVTPKGKSTCMEYRQFGSKPKVQIGTCTIRVARMVVEISGITDDAHGKIGEFTWKTIPLNPEWDLLFEPAVQGCKKRTVTRWCHMFLIWEFASKEPRTGTGKFKLYDDGWRFEDKSLKLN